MPLPPAAPGAARRRPVALAVASLLLVAAGVWVVRWFSDEAAIARRLRAAARAVEEERILAAATAISRRYSDPYGLTYESFLGGLQDVFTTYEAIRLPIDVDRVSVSGETAAVDLRFRLRGSAAGREQALLGETLSPARATLLVRRERGDWVIERVERVEAPNLPPPGAPAARP